ncbi:MAG: NADH-quinone oxidoreductase subunit NuoN, partial [Alphaproteobacteria bacterium]
LFVADGFSTYAKLLILVGAGVTAVMSLSYLEREGVNRFEYPLLVLFASLGMMMMISANNLIALYIGLELQSLPLYVLASIKRDDTKVTEAGLKYFVLGALSSGLLLYGCSLVYGYTGTTGFADLAKILDPKLGVPHTGLVVGFIFILTGLAFKIAAVPFHMWTPDVYEGAPTPVTAFFAAAPKIAAMMLIVRITIGPFGHLISEWQQVIIFLSIASMILGSVAAIVQKNIKRLMAYSSIGHVGYALVGLAAGNAAGIQGVILYMTIYMVMSVGTFACILAMRRQGRMVEQISDLAGLSRTQPLLALALAIFMFSMAGIPPLAGFFGKLYVFLAAVEAGLIGLAITGVLASVVGAFYYLRIVKVMYFDEAIEPFDRPIDKTLTAVLWGSSAFILLFIIFADQILAVTTAAAQAMYLG